MLCWHLSMFPHKYLKHTSLGMAQTALGIQHRKGLKCAVWIYSHSNFRFETSQNASMP